MTLLVSYSLHWKEIVLVRLFIVRSHFQLRHSMVSTRLGAVPVVAYTAVPAPIPRKPPAPLRSSHKGARKGRPVVPLFRLLTGVLAEAPVPNEIQPLLEALNWVYTVPLYVKLKPMFRLALSASLAASPLRVDPPDTWV